VDERCQQHTYNVRDYSGEGWVEWLAGEDGLEGSEQRHPLFSEGGKVPAQASERFGAVV
jgi:hypothetical protein